MELIGVSKPKIGYLGSSPDPNKIYFTPKQAYSSDLGTELTAYTDVDNAHDISHIKTLFSCDAIHLSGGDTFFFLTWLRQTGLDTNPKQYAATGKLLIVISAVTILITPSIETSSLYRNDDSLSDGNHQGLSLIPFHFWPHYTKDQDTSALSHLPTLTYGCPDGAGIIVNDDHLEFFGNISTFS